MKGIDVSRHQGAIDWAKVKADFAIIKLNYRGGMIHGIFDT